MGSAVVKPLRRRRGRIEADGPTDAKALSRGEGSIGDGNVNDNKVNVLQQKRLTFSNKDPTGCFSFRSSRPVKFSKSRRRHSVCEKDDSGCDISMCQSKTHNTQIHHNSPVLPQIVTSKPIEKHTRSKSIPEAQTLIVLPDIFSKQTQRSFKNIPEVLAASFEPFNCQNSTNTQPLTSQSTSRLNNTPSTDRNDLNPPSTESVSSLCAFDKNDKLIKTISLSTKDFNEYCLDRRKQVDIDTDICQDARTLSPEFNNNPEEDNVSNLDTTQLEGRESRASNYLVKANSKLDCCKERFTGNGPTSDISHDSQPTESGHDKQNVGEPSEPLVNLESNGTDLNIPEDRIRSPDKFVETSDCQCNDGDNDRENNNPSSEVNSLKHETLLPPQTASPVAERSNMSDVVSVLPQNPLLDVPVLPPARLAPLVFPGRSGPELKTFHMDGEQALKTQTATPVLCAGDVGDASQDTLDKCPNGKDRGDGNFKSSSENITANIQEQSRDDEKKDDKKKEIEETNESEIDEDIEAAAQEALSRRSPQPNPPTTLPTPSLPASSTGIISCKPPLPFLGDTIHSDRRVQSAGCSRLPPAQMVPALSKEDLKQQSFDEGLKPSSADGGVSFFVPASDQGLKPKTSGVDISERLTKPKRNQLRYEEKMMMANINRQIQISKRKKFALKDIASVKEALSATASSSDLSRPDHTRKSQANIDDDELDREFGL